MKKLLGIVVLGLLLSVNANSTGLTTIYCDSKFWNTYISLNINYDLNTVQHPDFKGGKTFNAMISEKSIFFLTEGERWNINRVTGQLDRYYSDMHQIAMCSTSKPKIKQKF